MIKKSIKGPPYARIHSVNYSYVALRKKYAKKIVLLLYFSYLASHPAISSNKYSTSLCIAILPNRSHLRWYDMAFVQWCFSSVMELCCEGQLPAEVNAWVLWAWRPVIDSLNRNPIPKPMGCSTKSSRRARPQIESPDPRQFPSARVTSQRSAEKHKELPTWGTSLN